MQSRAMSALEALSNVLLGLVVATLIQLGAFPVIGVQATLKQHLMLSSTFTVVSIIRSYLLRRGFALLERAQPASGVNSGVGGGSNPVIRPLGPERAATFPHGHNSDRGSADSN
jgi:hypothetical protein